MKLFSLGLLASAAMFATTGAMAATDTHKKAISTPAVSGHTTGLAHESGQIRVYDGLNVGLYKIAASQENLTPKNIEHRLKHGKALGESFFTVPLGNHYIPVTSVSEGLNAFSTKPVQINSVDDNHHTDTSILSTEEVVNGRKIIDGRIVGSNNTSYHYQINLRHELGTNNEIVDVGLNATSTDSAGEHQLVNASGTGTTSVTFKRHLGKTETQSQIVWVPFTIHNAGDKPAESYVVGVKLVSMPDPYDVQENYQQIRSQYKMSTKSSLPIFLDDNLGPKNPK